VKSNCIGLADLLCAYADGELAEQNIKLVEDHLAICENCSAILKTYKEISNSVNDTNVPAPDALRIGVMNRIKSESTPRKTDTDKLRRNYRMILTRFMPIAACLVVMLLVWQFWGDLFGVRSDNEAGAPAATPEEAMSAADFQMAAPAVAEDSAAPGGGYTDEAEEFGSPESRIVPESARSAEETEEIMDYFSKAFAEISFTGQLPPQLAGTDPLPFGSWFGWEMVFEIPSADVPALLEILEKREGFTVSYNMDNGESGYAVVFYSP